MKRLINSVNYVKVASVTMILHALIVMTIFNQTVINMKRLHAVERMLDRIQSEQEWPDNGEARLELIQQFHDLFTVGGGIR